MSGDDGNEVEREDEAAHTKPQSPAEDVDIEATEPQEPSLENAPSGEQPGDGDDEKEATPPPLSTTLLRDPIDQDERRWAYPVWLTAIISVLVLYHCAMLLVHNLPSKGLSKGLHTKFNKHLKMRTYMQATGNTQSWAMFAPNPHRSNIFMKVLVKDASGETWDLAHDIYGKRSYPYTFYDRMGKINRRIVDQKGYRRPYAAWVCRWWEQTHEGEPAEEVQFVKMWTRIPPPDKVIGRAKGDVRRMWYDPMKLHLHQREEDTFRCKTTRHAQLPNYLRKRYGLEPVDDNNFRPVHQRTWWDKRDSKEKSAKRTSADIRAASGDRKK